MSEGQAQSQESSVNTTSDVIAKRSLEGEALAFLGGSGPGHAPPENFENRDAQICVFRTLILGVFLPVELDFSMSVKTNLPSMSITLAGRGFLPTNTVACLSFLRSLSHLWRQKR